MSSLKERIAEDMKCAMKARDAAQLRVIRLLMAAMKQKEIDERIVLEDVQIWGVISKMLKQRHDSATQYHAAGRMDLVKQENFEIGILENYLPLPLDTSALDELIETTINALNANTIQSMGKVMQTLKEKLQGRADLVDVSQRVKEKLSLLSGRSSPS